jgi:hypothetical protein
MVSVPTHVEMLGKNTRICRRLGLQSSHRRPSSAPTEKFYTQGSSVKSVHKDEFDVERGLHSYDNSTMAQGLV